MRRAEYVWNFPDIKGVELRRGLMSNLANKHQKILLEPT